MPCFFTDQICFSYICKGSLSYYFCQIVYNSNLQRRLLKVSYLGTKGKLDTLPGWCFSTTEIRFSYFCRSPRKHSCILRLILAQLYTCRKSCHLKQMIDDGHSLLKNLWWIKVIITVNLTNWAKDWSTFYCTQWPI